MNTAPVRASKDIFYAALLVAIAVILFTAPSQAQSYPAVEGYVSFAVARTDYGTGAIHSPGFQFSGSYNPHRFIRVTGEFSGHFHGTTLFWNGEQMKLRDYQFLIGPELVFRNQSKVTPFVHVMGGYVTRHYNVGTRIYYCDQYGCSQKEFTVVGETGPGFQVGGGFDVAVHPNISIRAFQFDYLRTHMTRDKVPWLDPSTMPVLKPWQTHYRFAFGVVFRLGSRGAK